ncbi:MAG TPA: shikimate dehydrogenase [Rhabdaerophilum sp.]|nr:shikimate dehydrogenase [Rhabdaerophilum sp.]
MISGKTALIAHIGYPTSTFKAPMIYNPYFEYRSIDAVVVPMGVKAENYEAVFRSIFSFTNIHGALITMPHKVSTLALLDGASVTARIAGAVNAVRRDTDGSLVGDMFDGEGFVRGLATKGFKVAGGRALIVGAGGVGSAIAASLAAAGMADFMLFDTNDATAIALAERLRAHYPNLRVATGDKDPAGCDLVVNATPLGMNAGDPMPVDVARLDARTFVGEVVLKDEKTAFLQAAEACGCQVQIGLDMLFEMIPAYLEFFGFETTTAEELRRLARIRY